MCEIVELDERGNEITPPAAELAAPCSARDEDVVTQILDTLAAINRRLDRGALPEWGETIQIVGLAEWAVKNGFPGLADLHALLNEDEAE